MLISGNSPTASRSYDAAATAATLARNTNAAHALAPGSVSSPYPSASASSRAASLTPVQQGEALRRGSASDTSIWDRITSAVSRAVDSIFPPEPHSPIQVSSDVTRREDGTKVTTVYIDVQANYRVDGGALPSGSNAATEARAIETAIENDFSKTYTNDDGSITRYVARVDMTVGQPVSATREQFILVSASDTRLGGAGTLGIAPGFENGRTAFLSDAAGARTAPHEFGHLAGLRHTAQVSLGCATDPGIDIENLMSQTGCSPTSQQIERSQLQEIYNNPVFQ